MRNYPSRFLGAVALFFATVSSISAQDYIRKNKTAAQPASAASLEPTSPALAPSRSAANRNSPLTPGTEVSFQILEDKALSSTPVIISDTGELEVPGGFGLVLSVSGMTCANAEALVKNKLEGKFYKPGKATVQISIKSLPASGQKVSKVQMSGTIGRQTPILFYASDPKKLSEAVLEAGPTRFSNLKKVKVTRKGKDGNDTSEEYDVKSILEGGNSANDFPLQDGDRIFVPERGIVFGN